MADRSAAELQFRYIANQYVAINGAYLRAEAIAMEQQNIQYVIPRADMRIRQLIQRHKRKRFLQAAVAVAACIAMVLSIPALLQNRRQITNEQAADADKLMPLTFQLPENFVIAHTEVDDGKSIYVLTEARHDDVVLTMEHWDGSAEAFMGYRELHINGSAAYIETKADYQLLLFEKEGTLYRLTCKYEINTLIVLCGSVL